MAIRYLKAYILAVLLIIWGIDCSAPPTTEGINSLHFGGDCYIEIANCALLRTMLEGEFSIEVWAAADTSQATISRSIIMFGNNNGGNELGIFQGANDSSLVTVYVDERLFGNFNINGLDWRRGKFHHLCLTRTGDLFAFYFDGNLIDSRLQTPLDLNLGSSNVLIGADYDPPGLNANVGNYWSGYIDEVRLWRRQIASEEVLFHAQHPAKLLQSYSLEDLGKLVGLWRFNLEQSDFLSDESGNGLAAVWKGQTANFSWSARGK